MNDGNNDDDAEDNNDGDDQQDNNNQDTDDEDCHFVGDLFIPNDDEDNEDEPQAPEADEDADANVVQHEFQQIQHEQILHDNMEMLAVKFQNEDNNGLDNYNIEVGFYQCSTEEDEDDDDDDTANTDAEADTDEVEEMDESH